MCSIFVSLQNIHSATRDFEEGQREEKQKFIQASASSAVYVCVCVGGGGGGGSGDCIFIFAEQSKKEAMIKKQHEDVVQLLETQV